MKSNYSDNYYNNQNYTEGEIQSRAEEAIQDYMEKKAMADRPFSMICRENIRNLIDTLDGTQAFSKKRMLGAGVGSAYLTLYTRMAYHDGPLYDNYCEDAWQASNFIKNKSAIKIREVKCRKVDKDKGKNAKISSGSLKAKVEIPQQTGTFTATKPMLKRMMPEFCDFLFSQDEPEQDDNTSGKPIEEWSAGSLAMKILCDLKLVKVETVAGTLDYGIATVKGKLYRITVVNYLRVDENGVTSYYKATSENGYITIGVEQFMKVMATILSYYRTANAILSGEVDKKEYLNNNVPSLSVRRAARHVTKKIKCHYCASNFDAYADLYANTTYMSEFVLGSALGAIVSYGGNAVLSTRMLAKRWGWSPTRVGQFLNKLQKKDLVTLYHPQGNQGTIIYLNQYIAEHTMERDGSFDHRGVPNEKDVLAMLDPCYDRSISKLCDPLHNVTRRAMLCEQEDLEKLGVQESTDKLTAKKIVKEALGNGEDLSNYFTGEQLYQLCPEDFDFIESLQYDPPDQCDSPNKRATGLQGILIGTVDFMCENIRRFTNKKREVLKEKEFDEAEDDEDTCIEAIELDQTRYWRGQKKLQREGYNYNGDVESFKNMRLKPRDYRKASAVKINGATTITKRKVNAFCLLETLVENELDKIAEVSNMPDAIMSQSPDRIVLYA